MIKKETCGCGSVIEKDRQALDLDRCKKCAEADPGDPIHKRPLKNPSIALDRQAKSCAVFDDLDLRRDFKPYKDEVKAIQEALNWISVRNPGTPQLLLPHITYIKMSS
jgi:hypothetical protein